jgi:transposase-like protein
VSRPSYEQLLDDLQTMSFVAVGRKYGVSDNAVRKWLRYYEREK